jgi:DNA transformation protein
LAVSAEFLEFISEQLESFGPVEVKRMFGGAGIFREGLMFALIADEVLFLKVDETTRPDFESETSGPFLYEKNGKTMEMSYWRLPERLYDEPDEFTAWAQNAFSAALRADGKKSPSQRKHSVK